MSRLAVLRFMTRVVAPRAKRTNKPQLTKRKSMKKKQKRNTKKQRRSRQRLEVKNIRVLPSGYQVCVTREKTEFSKHFAGHTPKSLRVAETYRDMLLRELPSKRRHNIPPRVLKALKLKQAVVGVTRYPKRCYAVSYRDNARRIKTKTFSWRLPKDEIKAYAAAVEFRKKKLKP